MQNTFRVSQVRKYASRLMAAALLPAACGAIAEEAPSEWYRQLQENRPFAAVHALRQLSGHEQMLAQVSVLIGDEAPACALFGRVGFPDGVEYRDAIGVVSSSAADRRVVMLNESHFRSVHRAFLLRMIEALHEQGFDALAAETFAADAAARLSAGPVDAGVGFYTADPVFAAAIRKAQSLGWEFVSYESAEGGDKAARESGQARNLARWLNANPGRKLLVHAGGSHISKAPEDGWMASRLVELTGIDPLTIRQGATACPGQEAQWPVDSETPVVPVRGSGPISAHDADLLVVHPPAAVAAVKSALGQPIAVCAKRMPQDSLLRAFLMDDDGLAIARDQSIVPAGAREGVLHLAAGRYRIERESLGSRQLLGVIEVEEGARNACRKPGKR